MMLLMLLLLEVSGGTGQVTIARWMVTLEGRVISEGITPSFLTGLAAVFAIYYIFNLNIKKRQLVLWNSFRGKTPFISLSSL